MFSKVLRSNRFWIVCKSRDVILDGKSHRQLGLGLPRLLSTQTKVGAEQDVDKELTGGLEETQQMLNIQPFSTYGLSKLEDHREDFDSIARGLFFGKVDPRVFSYPDALPNDRLFALTDRCKAVADLFNKRKVHLVQSIDVDGHISEELRSDMKELGLFGMRAPVPIGGQGLYATEMMRVLEELSVNLSLSESVTIANTVGWTPFRKFASNAMRHRLESRLATGESTAAFCMNEPNNSGCDPNSCLTTATPTHTHGDKSLYYTINGDKSWVSNGDCADVYIISAKIDSKDADSTGMLDHETGEPSGVDRSRDGTGSITSFVIDKSLIDNGELGCSGEIIISQPESRPVGMRSLGLRNVHFRNVIIPSSCILGEVGQGCLVMSESVLTDRMFAGSRMAAVLRRVFNATLEFANERTSFGRKLIDFDRVKYKMSKMAYHIYALESMSYMTAGLHDIQSVRDVDLESCMVKLWANRAAKFFIDEILDIWGCRSYEEGNLSNLRNDLLMLRQWEGQDEMLYMTVALKALYDEINTSKSRFFPSNSNSSSSKFMSYYSKIRHDLRLNAITQNPINPALHLRIDGLVHPSLKTGAESLERSILRLEQAVTANIKDNGVNLQLKEVDLVRLAVMATDAYAGLCSLARAHRSYVEGIPHGQIELDFAETLNYTLSMANLDSYRESAMKYDECNDLLLARICDMQQQKGEYAISHPLTRTVF